MSQGQAPDAIPPGQRCVMGGCERPATDPDHGAGLCEQHHPEYGDDQESGDVTEDKAGEPRGSPAGDSPGGGETGDLQERAHEALADALAWFNKQIDRELPEEAGFETARDYYHARGWIDETIDEKLLGYAPADEYELRDHLMRQGHEKDAIRGCGLFYKDLTPHFQGRYVLPYFDRTGRPVYAISRSLDADDGGHPGDWTGGQKYTKAVKTKDYSQIDEPIYGAETVTDETDRLLVVGGIADAITLHQAGYACISPVTTVRFKERHESKVTQLAEEHDVDGVYMLNDAERPSVDKTELGDGETAEQIRDVLTIKQFGEGLRAAFGNAEFLLAGDIDPYLVTLPGGDDDLRKVDPDDLVNDNWADVETLLAAARHATEHRGFEQWRDDRQERAIHEALKNVPSGDGTPSSTRESAVVGGGDGQGGDSYDDERDNTSGLFDLSFTDVAPLSAGDRDDNPLGHHGDSHGYFVVVDVGGETVGYDHKYKAAYNALTFLLCDAGERRASAPNGPLDDGEIFAAWKHAKQEGALPDDDPIPTRALHHVAKEATEWGGELVERETGDGEPFDALPTDVYNAALEAVREEYDVDPGRDPIGRREPVAPIPTGLIDTLATDDRDRAQRRRGVETPTTDELRENLRNAVLREFRAGNMTVLSSPTSSGKTHAVATEPWRRRGNVTGGQPVVHLHETTDARDDAVEASSEAGVDYAVLRGRHEISPLARGDHDPDDDPDDDPDNSPEQVVTVDGEPVSQWLDMMCEDRGLPFSTALALARERNDQGLDELPPEGEEDPAVAQWNGLPTDDEGRPTHDVIHATHNFGYVPSLVVGNNVVIDEQPDYSVDAADGVDGLSQERIERAVTSYLREIGAPVPTWESLIHMGRHDGTGGDAAQVRDALGEAIGTDPSPEWFASDSDAHALAPALAEAVWQAVRWEETDANGRRAATVAHEPPRLDIGGDDDGEGFVRERVTVVIDDRNDVKTVRVRPDFERARAVVGLDAQPAVPLWAQNVAPGIDYDTVAESPEHRHQWRREERGLTVVQIGDHARPRSSNWATEWVNDERVRAVLERLDDQYGDALQTGVTTKAVKDKIHRLFEDATGRPPELMHYANEKSRNDFEGETVGYVYASMDPGDDYVLDAIAELGLDAEPKLAECGVCDGDGCHECDDTGETRAPGREFVGPDAETARELLASVRENHVVQALGRYARRPDDDDSQAVVYVHTSAIPDEYVDYTVSGVEWVATDLQQEIIDELARRPSATARELADAAECSKRHALKTVSRLEDHGLVRRHRETGENGADVFRAETDADDGELVDLGFNDMAPGDDPTANDALLDASKWSFVVDRPNVAESSLQPRHQTSEPTSPAGSGGGRPPDPPQ